MSHSCYILTYTPLQILERKRKRGRRKIDTIKSDRFIRERQNKQPFITGKQCKAYAKFMIPRSSDSILSRNFRSIIIMLIYLIQDIQIFM